MFCARKVVENILIVLEKKLQKRWVGSCFSYGAWVLNLFVLFLNI